MKTNGTKIVVLDNCYYSYMNGILYRIKEVGYIRKAVVYEHSSPNSQEVIL